MSRRLLPCLFLQVLPALLALALLHNTASSQTPVVPTTAPLLPSALPASTEMMPGAPPPILGGFTILVVPDTQYYSQRYPEIFHKHLQWIADNVKTYNVPIVLQLGDITETSSDAEWQVAKEAFGRLDGKVPYVLTPGNHDYGGRLQVLAKRSPMSTFFPVAHFAQMPTFRGVYDAEPQKSDNSCHTFTAGKRKWLVIALEFAPRNDVLRWAGDLCMKHSDHSAIIITHAYLEAKTNQRISFTGGYGYKPSPAAPGQPPAEKPDVNLGVDIWEKLASRHANVAMVLCGHTSYTNHKRDTGIAGNTVHEVVVDYQRDVNGGNGWMRLLQFLPDGRTVRTRDYSPILNQTCTMPDRSYDMDFAPIGAASANPAAAAKMTPPNPSLAPIADVPGLPRVLLIGDSISMGYTLPVRKLLEGRANVHRIPQNGGPTKSGTANIDKWLGTGKWDVIHFNWGIHDLKIMEDSKRQVEPAAYEQNLRTLITRMQATGAKLIWATTTPIPDGELNPPRQFGRVKEYNDIAAKIMAENGIPTDDLNAHVTPEFSKLSIPKDLHYTPAGSEHLAKKVAEEITKLLPVK